MREDPPLPKDGEQAADAGPTAEMLVRAKPIFLAARELQDSERQTMLDEMCAGDASLRAVVETLLAAEQVPLRFDTLADEIVTARQAHDGLEVGADALAGTSIGRYRIIEQIGEGAFGVVYLAQQERPAGGKVAIKILKLGMDTRQIVSRFEAERQALSMMDHPAIARVFDAGATPTGRPYFVMEFVRGEPITAYCDKRHFSIRQRLELFRLVCDGVQHAHQKGVIHRDLKPGNVLVAEVDGKPYPKIIDFGIAKATQGRSAGLTQYTEQGQLMGTPTYMSPEQAVGDADIDTRTDVYSLGVLLYELMTGDTPIPATTMRSTPTSNVQRLVLENDLAAPSSRFKRDSSNADDAALARGLNVPRLRATLRGDLDWIVLKALERERSRRYTSAADLEADITRHLKGDAVLAAPPSRWYAMRKAAHKHRGVVSAIGAVIAALALGLLGTAWMALKAQEQAGLAKAAAKAEAERAAELRAVTTFQSQMLARIDAFTVGGLLKADVRERIERVIRAGGVAGSSGGSGSFDAALDAINFTDVGTTFVDQALLRPAIAELNERFSMMPRVNAQLRRNVAAVYHSLGNWDASLSQYEMALQLLGGPGAAPTLDTLHIRYEMAILMKLQRRFTESQAMLNGLLLDLRRTLGSDHVLTLNAQTEMGNVHRLLGQVVDAIRVQGDVYERCRTTLGPSDDLTLSVMNNYAKALSDDGQLDRAEQLLRDAAKQRERMNGPDDPRTLSAEHNLGLVLHQRRDLDGAKTYLCKAVTGRAHQLGFGHEQAAMSAFSLVEVLTDRGELTEADALLREVLGAYPERPYLARAQTQLGFVRMRLGRFLEAEAALLEARRIAESIGDSTLPQDRLLRDLFEAWQRADPASDAASKLAKLKLVEHRTPAQK